MTEQLEIFCAGVAAGLTKKIAGVWNAEHPVCTAAITVGGSVDLIRRAKEGEPCDLLILADDTNIEQMLLPDYVDGYGIWAANQMVVASANGEDISQRDWKELLLAEDAVFAHMDPYGDPAGYRAVMALMLADEVEQGLSEKLLKHPGYLGGQLKPGEPGSSQADYVIVYGSLAKARNMSYITLPDVMNLSRMDYADIYRKAVFQISDTTQVSGAPIRHGVTILNSALHKVEAEQFLRKFMALDFSAFGFLPLQ